MSILRKEEMLLTLVENLIPLHFKYEYEQYLIGYRIGILERLGKNTDRKLADILSRDMDRYSLCWNKAKGYKAALILKEDWFYQ